MSARVPAGRFQDARRGFILIAALGILAVLAVLSMEYARLARHSADRAGVAAGALSGFYAAESGVERAKALLGEDSGQIDSSGELWRNKAAYAKEIAGWTTAVRVTDEESKINLNTADAAVLSRLLEQFGVDRRDRDIFAGSLLDWIDANELHRANGAESDYYRSHGFPYGSKNAPLESLEEISRIHGFPAGLTERTAGFGADRFSFIECASVAGDTRVNINTAPPPVLAALGCSTDEIRAILKARARAPFSAPDGIGPVIGVARAGALAPYLRVSSKLFLVESTASSPTAAPVTVYALLRRISRRVYTAGFWS